jgi:hypothetical protein
MTSTGGRSSSLYQEGRFSLGSFALDSVVFDRSQNATSDQQRTSSTTRSGNAFTSVTLVRSTTADSDVSAHYGTADTGATTYTGGGLATLTQTRSTSFSRPETLTRSDKSNDSVSEHQAGTFGNASMSLACYSLDRSGAQTFSLSSRATTTTTVASQDTDSRTGQDGFDHEADSGAYSFGTTGTFARSSTDVCTTTGTTRPPRTREAP